ncbi:hypothetical protein ACFYRG_19540 [Streptomyces mirabilis]
MTERGEATRERTKVLDAAVGRALSALSAAAKKGPTSASGRRRR